MTSEPNPLDNPIWSALTTDHAPIAISYGAASRYSPEVSPMAALREPSEQAFSDLTALVTSEESVGLFTSSEVCVPPGWEVERERWIDQMSFESGATTAKTFAALNEKDVPDMLALTALTEPGPFNGHLGRGFPEFRRIATIRGRFRGKQA